MPDWLKNAVFYEIYPQSFYDTNGDGIGDIPGIIEKLDYIKELGCNALWINPCFDSPFKDAGYDVRDYYKVAPRYGTNEDLYRLFEAAHRLGIHVLLDLVAGHTSEEHAWFQASGKAERNEFSDRYIWTDFWISGIAGHPYIGGECERNGTYMLNFFKCQPALNYGFLHPTETWQMSPEDAGPQATKKALMDIIRYWLDRGCDGFRVDMADSLVKDDDEKKSGTCAIWREIRTMLDEDYPEAAFVSEWSNPWQAINSAGFHMDFYLDHWNNGYHTLMRDYHSNGEDHSYFKKDADGDITRFLDDYLPRYRASRENGYMSLITCNHDTPRASYTLEESELKLAYATLLTLPGVPFIYYGDEIGMRYIDDMPTKEGGYTRTGTRTPMQWDSSKNLGFSTADPEQLYLPVDDGTHGESDYIPTVEEQMARENSLYHVIQAILKLRSEQTSLHADADLIVLCGEKDKPFVYQRGDLIIAVNPRGKAASMSLPCQEAVDGKVLYQIGEITIENEALKMGAQSFAVFIAD